MHTVDCAGCGTEFQCSHKRSFCSKICRKRIANFRYKGGDFTGPRQCDVYGVPVHRDCVSCGVSFTPKQNYAARYCSRSCRDKRPRRFAECVGCGERFGICQGGGKTVNYCSLNCKREHRRPSCTPVEFRQCECCGKQFCAKLKHVKQCTICKDNYPQHTRNKIAAGDAATTCVQCGVQYCRITISRQRCCSDECKVENVRKLARSHKAKRRKHITDGDSFDPYEIFERDKWCCRHCRRKAPKRLRGTYHPRAPELDHILPLSQGGKHCKANAQLLCRECNQTKSNGSLYDQTLLFG